jgi:ketosteroid isomerase-like protein
MTRCLALLVFGLAACRGAADPAASVPDTTGVREALLAADRAFADSTAARRLDGWMGYYSADAVRLTMGGDVAQGLEAVRKYDAPLFADSTTRLLWTPTGAGAFADGRHGFTTGTSLMLRTAAGKTDTVYRGAYITMWRREADGRWKVILDTGS